MAAWMATEIWHAFGKDTPITLIPVADGRLEVLANGKFIYDRKQENGLYPDLKRVREIKKSIQMILEELAVKETADLEGEACPLPEPSKSGETF